ncbi:hypothetical protein [Solimonas marina]|uniref:Uncharacterized protein n=1 Tax=Solimonas marina TaxID=2714601 RepID=A0A969WAZ6_9GAMM|nr:hypothetical protein [Solimonas marina]NKF21570.1 hypothetical protein [Solimonas marina]
MSEGFLKFKYRANQIADSLRDAVSNARLNTIRDAVDAGPGAGKLRIYTSPRPAAGAAITTQTLLATLTFADPCAPDAAAGILQFSDLTAEASAPGAGTALWARVTDSDDNFVLDLGVGALGSGYDIELLDIAVTAGDAVSLNSALAFSSE